MRLSRENALGVNGSRHFAEAMSAGVLRRQSSSAPLRRNNQPSLYCSRLTAMHVLLNLLLNPTAMHVLLNPSVHGSLLCMSFSTSFSTPLLCMSFSQPPSQPHCYACPSQPLSFSTLVLLNPCPSQPLPDSTSWILPYTVIANQYMYVYNSPLAFVDPAGLQPSAACQKALAALNSAIKGGESRIQQNLKNPNFHPGHAEAKRQAITRILNRMSAVIYHCGCAIAQCVIDKANSIIDEIQRQLDALQRAITSRSFLQALAILLVILALLAALAALFGASVCLA
jgi:hypothetical protein